MSLDRIKERNTARDLVALARLDERIRDLEVDRLERINALRDSGAPMARIAAAVGLTTDGLYKLLRRRQAGIPQRRRA